MTENLRSLRFRKENEKDWQRLETLVIKVEGGGARRLAAEEAIELPRLYRTVLSSLSVARETLLERATLDYLEALVARSYFAVYGAHQRPSEAITHFFAVLWPKNVRRVLPELGLAVLFLALGAAGAWFLVASDPDWFYSIVDRTLAGGRGPEVPTARMRDMLYEPSGVSGLGQFAASLFSNNTGVSLLAFALGFAVGLPTAVLLIYNGAVLGAMLQVYFAKGLGVGFSGWLLIHGVTELLAIALAGAAGLRIGRAVAFPGRMTRIGSARQAGREAAPVMVGVVLMLILAALIEGYGRQLINNDAGRYGVACLTGVFWLLYFAKDAWPQGTEDRS